MPIASPFFSRQTMKAKGAITVVLAVIIFGSIVKLHFILDEGGGGYVLWKKDEAYLLMYDRPIGYRISILGYLLMPIREYFYAPAIPVDDKWALAVVRITPAETERYSQQSTVEIRNFTPIESEIYAHCPGGLCKWTGSEFHLISGQEEQEIGGEDHLSKREFANVSGWSKLGIKGTSVGDDPGQYELSINLDTRTTLQVRGGNPVSVDLLRPGRSPERVWYHEQRTRRVSSNEYEQVFHH